MIGAKENVVTPDLYMEPLVGYRVWMMTSHAQLMGVTHHLIWPHDMDAHATCERSGPVRHNVNEVPVENCGCGYYAYWDYAGLRASMMPWQNKERSVRGAVIAWGRTWLHSKGFRAQYSRPIAFVDWPERSPLAGTPGIMTPRQEWETAGWREVAKQLAKKYNVPLIAEDQLEQYASEFGRKPA